MQNIKKSNTKIIIMTIIALVSTFALGLIFIFNANSEFIATKTVWGTMIEGVDGDTPGSGELVIIASIISGFAFLGELTAFFITISAFFGIPVLANSLILIVNFIARLFQIGETKEWKDVTTKVWLYFSIVLQGLLNVYILFLCFTGYGLVYLLIYLMLIINVFAFIKNILSMRKSKIQIQTNVIYN